MTVGDAAGPANALPMVRAPMICVGDIMVDVLARLTDDLVIGSDRPAEVHWLGGGSAANTAAWLAVGGTEVTLVARIGDDPLGAHAARELRESGVGLAVAVDFDLPTGCCIVLVSPDGERTMVPDAGANAALAVDALPDNVLTSARHLHLSAYPLFGASRTAVLAILQNARANGLTISVDAASAGPLRALASGAFLDWIGPGALLFANADEAEVLTGAADPATAARTLARHTGHCVVKLGARGALWADPTDVLTVPSQPVDVVDTTGAGDAFAAGVLGALSGGADVAAAMAAGHRLAARACQTPGGRPSRRPTV